MNNKVLVYLFVLVLLGSFAFGWTTAPGSASYYRFDNNLLDTISNNNLQDLTSTPFSSNAIQGSHSLDTSAGEQVQNSTFGQDGFTPDEIRTISIWFNATSWSADNVFLTFSDAYPTQLWLGTNGVGTGLYARNYNGGIIYHMSSPSLPSTGTWNNLVLVMGTPQTELWLNGAMIDNDSSIITLNANWDALDIGDSPSLVTFRGLIDNVYLDSVRWDASQVESSYNLGHSVDYGVISGGTEILTNIFNSNSTEDKVENISIRLENYNITSLSNATLIYNNTEYSGAINYQNINNVTFSANVDTPLIYNPEETIYFYWNYTLLYSNGSIENLLSPLENQSITWNLTSYPRINISATNNLLSTPIGNFSINGVPYESNAFIINSAGVHAYTISSFGYETKTENVTFIGGNLTQYTFNLYTRNSISLNILDENTDAPIIENVSIRFYSDIFGEFINYTNSSTFYIDDLNASEYQITLKSGNYSERTYILTVSENSSQSLNAYLSKNLSSTLFTIRDRDTGDTLEDVLLTMYRNINTSWVAVESQYSDITGRAEFTYNLGANYKFFASKDFYTDYVFYLEPILFSEYDVRIIRDIEANNTGDFQGVSIIYSPYSYDNNKNNTFTFIIQSPDGELVYYGYNITTPSGSYTNSGSNAIGGQLNTEVEITGGDYFDKVTIDYYYYTSISGHRDFTANFPINNPNGGNQTFMSNNDKKYGLGLFERVFIITIIIIFIVGIASLVGQPIPGMVLSLFVYGYMAYMGFIELWAIIITIMIGVFFLSWKTGA